MFVGEGLEMANKTGVILEVFVEKFFAGEQGVNSVDDYTNVSILDIGLGISIQWRVLASDGGGNLANHPSHGLTMTNHVHNNMR